MSDLRLFLIELYPQPELPNFQVRTRDIVPRIKMELAQEEGLMRTVKDLFAGAMGGVAQVLLGCPA